MGTSVRMRAVDHRERQKLLRELRSATRHATWPEIHRLRAVLDEVPLLDELAVLVVSARDGGSHFQIWATRWLVRLLVEREMGGLPAIAQLVDLIQHLNQKAARIKLAALLSERGRMDARTVLGVTVPPPQGANENLLDYQDRLRSIGLLNELVAYECARHEVWRY